MSRGRFGIASTPPDPSLTTPAKSKAVSAGHSFSLLSLCCLLASLLLEDLEDVDLVGLYALLGLHSLLSA